MDTVYIPWIAKNNYVLIIIKNQKKEIHQNSLELTDVYMESNVEMDSIVNTTIDLKNSIYSG